MLHSKFSYLSWSLWYFTLFILVVSFRIQTVKYHKDHGRYENFECSTDLHYTGAVIEGVVSCARTPVYTCLLCKSTPKLLSQKSPWPRGWCCHLERWWKSWITRLIGKAMWVSGTIYVTEIATEVAYNWLDHLWPCKLVMYPTGRDLKILNLLWGLWYPYYNPFYINRHAMTLAGLLLYQTPQGFSTLGTFPHVSWGKQDVQTEVVWWPAGLLHLSSPLY